jgi:hypothetical protein
MITASSIVLHPVAGREGSNSLSRVMPIAAFFAGAGRVHAVYMHSFLLFFL